MTWNNAYIVAFNLTANAYVPANLTNIHVIAPVSPTSSDAIIFSTGVNEYEPF